MSESCMSRYISLYDHLLISDGIYFLLLNDLSAQKQCHNNWHTIEGGFFPVVFIAYDAWQVKKGQPIPRISIHSKVNKLLLPPGQKTSNTVKTQSSGWLAPASPSHWSWCYFGFDIGFCRWQNRKVVVMVTESAVARMTHVFDFMQLLNVCHWHIMGSWNHYPTVSGHRKHSIHHLNSPWPHSVTHGITFS